MDFRRLLLLTLLISAGNISAAFSAPEDSSYIPGKTYYGQNSYIQYTAGNLPIVLSAPHGGSLTPSEIPDRTWGTVSTDVRTKELISAAAQEIYNLTGRYAHIIINNLKRIKLDANRDSLEAAQGNIFALQAWNEYMDFVAAAENIVSKDYKKGLYIDIHGHGHAMQQLELGYLLTASDLDKPDDILNSQLNVSKSSVRNLVLTNTYSHKLSDIVRGNNSLGSVFEANGIPAVPDKLTFSPGSLPYFNGGYCTERFGSAGGGSIDGIQIEHHSKGIRDSDANLKAYAKKFARVLLEYVEYYYGFSFIAGISDDLISASNFSLEQNYPNPFNPSTSISYSVSRECMVRLTIYDAMGHEIGSYVNSVQTPGIYTVKVDMSKIARSSGAYFYRLTAGAYSLTRKMLLLK